MLVLSRRLDESIIMTLPDGVEIEIAVVDLRSDKVRIGITAPDYIAIHRYEINAQIQREIGDGMVVPSGVRQPRGPLAIRLPLPPMAGEVRGRVTERDGL